MVVPENVTMAFCRDERSRVCFAGTLMLESTIFEHAAVAEAISLYAVTVVVHGEVV